MAELKGQRELERTLRRIARDVPDEVSGALFRQAQFVAGDARENHVPVGMTPLQSSIEVKDIEVSRTRIQAKIVAGGPSAPYALAMHEHPSEHSPPSWKGKTLSFTKPGTGHKFLEKPLRKKQATLLAELAADIDIGRLA